MAGIGGCVKYVSSAVKHVNPKIKKDTELPLSHLRMCVCM